MIIVDKLKPTEVVKQINKAALVRLRRKKEITSNSTEEHVTTLLHDLYSDGQWLICDCRPDLDIECAPGMSVVKRAGVLFLRNLPSRKPHEDNCVFKYMKTLPWLAKQEVLPSEGDVEGRKNFSAAHPADLLLEIVREAEWLSYDPDFEFLSMIDKVASVSQRLTLDGECLSKVLKQSATPLFKGDDNPRASLFLSHDINFSEQTLIREIRNQKAECRINGGIVPAVPLSSIPGGPYLSLVTTRTIDGMQVLSCAFIPVSSRQFPIPVLNRAERGFAILMQNYASWLNKSESVSIGFGKIISDVQQLPFGFSIYSGERAGEVKFSDAKIASLDGSKLTVPMSMFDETPTPDQSNFIKSKIREIVS